MKTEQNKQQNKRSFFAILSEELASNGLRSKLVRKTMLLILSFGLLVTVGILGATAWYTKVTKVETIKMNVATFDFKANYSDEDFVISTKTENGKETIAPGSTGMFPVLLASEYSTIPVAYDIQINSKYTAKEFQERIRYYYYANDGSETDTTLQYNESGLSGGLAAGEEGIYEYIYWEWVYEPTAEKFYHDGTWYTCKTSASALKAPVTVNGISYSTYGGLFKAVYTDDVLESYNQFDTNVGIGLYNDTFYSTQGSIASPGGATYTSKGEFGTEDFSYAYQSAMGVRIYIESNQGVTYTLPGSYTEVTEKKTSQGSIYKYFAE